MSRIGFEQNEIFIGELLNMHRELLVAFPESRQRVWRHGSGVKLPESISASIFSTAFSCFPPGEKFSSSSSSQASLSRRAMYAANLVNSSGGNASTAFSISARLMKKHNDGAVCSQGGWSTRNCYRACKPEHGIWYLMRQRKAGFAHSEKRISKNSLLKARNVIGWTSRSNPSNRGSTR